MNHDNFEANGTSTELVSYGRGVLTTLKDMERFVKKGVRHHSLSDIFRDHAKQSCLTGIGLLKTKRRLGDGFWLILSEHAQTFAGAKRLLLILEKIVSGSAKPAGMDIPRLFKQRHHNNQQRTLFNPLLSVGLSYF